MSTLVLPQLLAEAGCSLTVVKRQVAVLDRDRTELARGSRLQATWLWTASTAALIERRADELGFRHELHPEKLLFRLWRSGVSREAAPWQTFPDTLTWLAQVERAIALPRQVRFHLVRSGPITRRAGPGERGCGPEGQAPPEAGQAPDERSHGEPNVSPEPITDALEPWHAETSVIGREPGGRQLGRAALSAGGESAEPGLCEPLSSSEPITSTQELQYPNSGVMRREMGAAATLDQVVPDAGQAIRAGLMQHGPVVPPGSITRSTAPGRTVPGVIGCGPGGRAPPGCPAPSAGRPDDTQPCAWRNLCSRFPQPATG